MADFTIYCDDLQEGIWFQELDPHFENAELEVIPSKKAEIMSCGLDEVLKYDRPDIILKDENNVIFVLERTVEVPSGHNVDQRYGRLLAAAEANIPIVYFGPYMAYKHGGNTAGPRYMNLRLFYSLKKASELYNTAVTTINWPVDRDCEVLKTPAKDNRIKQYLNLFFSYYDRFGQNGLSQYIKNSAFQAEQYREQEAFARKEIRNPGQYNYPPESLEIISVSSFCNRYGLNLQLPRSIQSVVLYHIGMTYIRSDPYVGMAALYKTLYGDESNIVVLEFANIDSSSWFEQQRTSKTYRMYKTFCDAILFRDEFIWQEKL